MSGMIRRREVLAHSILVVHLYGWRVYWACLFAKSGETFLGIVARRRIDA